MTAPSAVAVRYPAGCGLTWVPLGSAGGFSGASVWRGEAAGQPVLALKAWPPGYPADRLTWVHAQMTATGLPFVPRVFATDSGETAVEHAGRVWDVTAWMPGVADFRRSPTDLRLAAACASIADLHRVWGRTTTLVRFPAVARRLAVLSDWPTDVPAHLGRAVAALRTLVPRAVAELRPLAGQQVGVHPCLCDVWHDHVLFTGDRVTGVIDYGAMKPDHPAVDLARLLGDLVGDEPDRVRFGVAAYRQAGGSPAVTPELVALLDRTGLVGAVAVWVRRLSAAPPTPAAEARLDTLLDRLDRLSRRS
jgi:homoserine kinase type II